MTDSDEPWWTSAVFYQIYPRSFADANADGTGDLAGITSRIGYLQGLGVDALWLSPFYRSPMADGGYDVCDPTDVDPRFGSLADFDVLLAAAHQHGVRVTIDLVPNHVSVEHRWFQQALADGPHSPARRRFLFADGRGPDGSLPPNNWPSAFAGPAWTRLPDGQWYLHLFAPEQPDLNWDNPEVRDEFDRVMRFWLDRGVDGFRIDVAHGLVKAPGLPDADPVPGYNEHLLSDPRFDQDGVHEHLRRFRAITDEYPGRVAVGEVWTATEDRLARYVRPDELHLAFNFGLLEADWGASAFRTAIANAMASLAAVGGKCTWVLSNHDTPRPATRYGGGPGGRRRAAAAALVQLSLPGPAFLYQGDELALENVDDLPEEVLDDPTWVRSGYTLRGRDGQRVPLPWSGDRSPFGFSGPQATRPPWLPIPQQWAALSVHAQDADHASPLWTYRRALATRRRLVALRVGDFSWVEAGPHVLAYRRATTGAAVTVLLNTGSAPIPLPEHAELIACSLPLDGTGVLPPDTTVWLAD